MISSALTLCAPDASDGWKNTRPSRRSHPRCRRATKYCQMLAEVCKLQANISAQVEVHVAGQSKLTLHGARSVRPIRCS